MLLLRALYNILLLASWPEAPQEVALVPAGNDGLVGGTGVSFN